MEINKPKTFKINQTEASWFNSLLHQMCRRYKSDYPNSIFFHINNEVYMEIVYDNINREYGKLYINYTHIWQHLESFGFTYQQIKDFIKVIVEEKLNLSGLEPINTQGFQFNEIDNFEFITNNEN